MSLCQEIENLILQSIPEAQVQVTDPMEDGAHLEAVVISPSFEGLSLVKQQRSVMKVLEGHFASSLHALALKTYTPAQWQEITQS